MLVTLYVPIVMVKTNTLMLVLEYFLLNISTKVILEVFSILGIHCFYVIGYFLPANINFSEK